MPSCCLGWLGVGAWGKYEEHDAAEDEEEEEQVKKAEREDDAFSFCPASARM